MENLHFQTVRWWLIIENVKPSKWILFLLEKNYPLIGIICGWTNSCTSSYVSRIPFFFTVFNQTPTNIKKTVPYSSAVGFLPRLVLVIPTTSTPEVWGVFSSVPPALLARFFCEEHSIWHSHWPSCSRSSFFNRLSAGQRDGSLHISQVVRILGEVFFWKNEPLEVEQGPKNWPLKLGRWRVWWNLKVPRKNT